jgi:hypothetical protein
VLRAFEECKRALGIRGGVGLAVQSALDAPAVMGAMRPTLALPEDAARLGAQQLRHVLLHELAHVKRGDLWAMLLMNALCAVYWFAPPVWLYCRLVRADIETACDHRVLRELGRSQRLPYIATVLQYTGRPHKPGLLAAAMGLCDGRPAMEKRIAGMFRAARTGFKGRAAAAALALMMLAASALTACQPTPTDPVVVNKGDGKLEDALKATAEPRDAQGTPAPKKYTDSFKGANESVTIRIDADVTEPLGGMPVVQVKPHMIDMEQIKSMAKVLFRGNTAYEPKVAMSKADLQAEILSCQKHISDDKALLEYYGGDQKAANEVKKEYQQRIAAYQAQLANAPEKVERRETDWTFRPDAYYTDMVVFGANLDGKDDQSQQLKQMYYDSQTIQLDADMEGYHARINVMNLDTDELIQHYAYFNAGSGLDAINTPMWNEADAKPMAMTRAEAVTMVYDALAQMGLGNMRLNTCFAYGEPETSVAPKGMTPQEEDLYKAAGEGLQPQQGDADETGKDVYRYEMTFIPTYEGVAVIPTDQFSENNVNSSFGPNYDYERLQITVQNGIITSFRWIAPMEQTGVENADVKLIPFDEIFKIFKRQMQLEYTLGKLSRYSPENPDYEEYISKIESGEIDITNIQLGLTRIAVKDRPGAYRMVPVWTFMGHEQFQAKGNEKDIVLEKNMGSRGHIVFTYAIINAIDGSIVDPSQGY